MFFMPFNVLGMWFRGLLSVAVLGGGLYLLHLWHEDSYVVEREPVAVEKVATEEPAPATERRTETAATVVAQPERRVFRFDPGWNRPTGELAAALVLLIWATGGRLVVQGLSLLTRRTGPSPSAKTREGLDPLIQTEADLDPESDRTGEVHRIERPDGSILHVECYGPPDAPPIVWTHGWGADSTEWFYPKRYLAERFRLIVWDEPGLGRSRKPTNNDYRLETFAANLDAVLALAGGRPALLVGHSIGGMTTLTFCKEYPEALGTRVAGLVLAHTTYTNPVRTAPLARLFKALESPVLIPLMHVTIALWPLLWVMNWMSYLNGSTHRSAENSGFSGDETRGQLDFAAHFTPRARPDVLARGMLGMMAYDATDALTRIDVPTLVVGGDQDTSTPPEAGEFIARRVPDARLVTLSPAKHMGLFEHHDRFDRLVSEFAEKCLHAGVKG